MNYRIIRESLPLWPGCSSGKGLLAQSMSYLTWVFWTQTTWRYGGVGGIPYRERVLRCSLTRANGIL